MRRKLLMMPAVVLLACAAGMAPPADDIVRQGAGERRQQLNSMELQPVDRSFLNGLSNWTNGGPLTAADLDGNVTLIMTWSSWFPPANRMLPMARRLAERHADDGLKVLVVHREPEWDGAVKAFEGMPSNMILAQDDGSFRSTLLAAQDPDFYLIDRAGHMRFAAIDNRSVERAVQVAVSETREQARSIPQNRQQAAQQQEEERWRTRGVSAEYVRMLRGQDDLEFDLPPATAYGSVKWPESDDQSGGWGQTQSISGLDGMMGGWSWVSNRPAIQGKVVVIDFWRTWCGPCRRAKPALDALQERYRDEVAVIALSGPDGRGESESRVRSFMAGRNAAYFTAFDQSNALMEQLNVSGFPTVVVLSSDGVIRWRGNPHSRDFRRTVDAMVSVDPGVQARRQARAEMLRRLERQDNR